MIPYFCFLLLTLVSRPAEGFEPPRPDSDFETSAAALFSAHCVDCHNGQEKKGGLDLTTMKSAFRGGNTGPGLVPGDLKGSQVWERIRSGEMPPQENSALDQRQLERLRKWILAGAEWPAGRRLGPYEFSTDTRGGKDWWSFQPVRRPALPFSGTLNSNGNRKPAHPVDQFVDQRMLATPLSRSGPATRRVLVRRLFFGLTGLPPTPNEVAEFLDDRSPDAYEKLVDRLLASPRYGERWGRHWLDIAHYADTHGYERDQRRLHAWRYRDYVIQSFNLDRRYDEFLLQQIAGDILQPDKVEANIATGFLACGPYDFTGIEETVSETLRRQAMADDLDDLVTTVLTSTMGLTINCARCHNHKFDPIPQKDYYRLAAVFAGVSKKDRVTTSLEEFRRLRDRKKTLNGELSRVNLQIRSLGKTFDLADVVAGGNGSGNAPGGLALDPRTGIFLKGNTGMLKDVRTNRFVRGLSRFVDGCFVPDGEGNEKTKVQITSSGLRVALPGTSGACWDYFQKGPCNAQDFTDLDEVDFNQEGHTLLSIHSNKGITFDLGEIRNQLGVTNLRFTSTMGFGGKHAGSSAAVHIFLDGQTVFSRTGVGRSSGGIPIEFAIQPRQRFLTLVVTDDGNGIGHDQIFFGDPWLRSVESENGAVAKQIRELTARRGQIEEELKSIDEPAELVFAAVPRDKIEPVHLLIRGNPENRGPEVEPGGLSLIAGSNPRFGGIRSKEGARRRALAEWIVDSRNPLTARVIVNRLWHHHFGRGIVETPSDFGFLGGKPSHPELLDWLASELIEHDWSLKHLQRLIVTSATYRQSSSSNPLGLQLDVENRLLWRWSPRRLETEALRDAVLATSGTLNRSYGGPGYQDFEYVDKYAPVYRFVTADRPEWWRRTVYRFTVRSVPNRFMKVLDCPNPSSLTPKRNETTTSLQSLALLNNPFMIDQARHFARRLQRTESTTSLQIQLAFELAFSRAPSKQELASSIRLANEHGLFYLCRAILNANEFVYLD